MNEEDVIKQKVQKWIVSLSTLILLAKFAAYGMTLSVGILTDALESIVNVAAGIISLLSLRYAARPGDKEHPFGHGKMELISASVEGILISLAGLFIIYEGVERLLQPQPLRRLDVGIYIVAAGGVANYLMGAWSERVGRRSGSMALIAGGRHLKSDTYSTIGLVAGLTLLHLTHLTWIDSALALLFGTLIIITGISILRKTTDNLLDHADEELLTHLADQINHHRRAEWIDIHNVKAIKSGSYLYLDCDLTIPWYYTVEHGHRLAHELTDMLQGQIGPRLQATVHLDPCNVFAHPKCHVCALADCPHRREPAPEEPEPVSLTALTAGQPENVRTTP